MSTAFLCESCGYPIHGLPTDSHCPECGTPIKQSLPARRAGSPWQRRPGLIAWFTTNAGTLAHPRRRFAELVIDHRHARSLAVTNILVAAAFLWTPWVGVFIGDPARAAYADHAVVRKYFTLGAAFAGGAFLLGTLLFILTLIERSGIRFFASRREWRLTRAAASQICAHATVGWIIAALAPLVLAPLTTTLISALDLGGKRVDLSPLLPWNFSLAGALTAAGIALGYFAGLFVFELLVYTGVRQNKFANPAATIDNPSLSHSNVSHENGSSQATVTP